MAAAIFAVIFFGAGVVHGVQIIRTKGWYFTAMLIGTLSMFSFFVEFMKDADHSLTSGRHWLCWKNNFTQQSSVSWALHFAIPIDPPRARSLCASLLLELPVRRSSYS